MFETEKIRMFNEQVRQVTQILHQSLSQLSVAFALMPRAKLLGFFFTNFGNENGSARCCQNIVAVNAVVAAILLKCVASEGVC